MPRRETSLASEVGPSRPRSSHVAMNHSISDWIQSNKEIDTKSESTFEAREPFSDAGLLSELYAECFTLLKTVYSIWKELENDMSFPSEQTAHLNNYCQRFSLWRDLFQGSKLEISLRIVPDIQRSVLETLTKIGHVLIRSKIPNI